MATMNVSLPDAMKEWVEARAASGEYANASDYVRDLIRHDRERRQAIDEINAEIQKGLDSGPAEPFDFDEFLAEMRAKHGVA